MSTWNGLSPKSVVKKLLAALSHTGNERFDIDLPGERASGLPSLHGLTQRPFWDLLGRTFHSFLGKRAFGCGR